MTENYAIVLVTHTDDPTVPGVLSGFPWRDGQHLADLRLGQRIDGLLLFLGACERLDDEQARYLDDNPRVRWYFVI